MKLFSIVGSYAGGTWIRAIYNRLLFVLGVNVIVFAFVNVCVYIVWTRC